MGNWPGPTERQEVIVNWQSWIFMVLAVVAGPVIGALISGLDRKLTARMQSRVGPPIFQPFYDVIKLFYKEPLAVNVVQILYVYLHLAFMVLAIILIAMGQDLLMALFAHAFSTIALILGGMSVRSPYSRIGSTRKILQMVAYEPILLIAVIGVYLATGSFTAHHIFELPQPLLVKLPLIFVAFLVAMAIKMEKSPFDVATSHHAHQEIVKGITLEYTGPYLALIEITHFYEVFLFFLVVACFWSTNLLIGLGLSAAAFFALILLDNTFARLTTMWMVRFMWTTPLALALSNLIWFYVK